MPIHRAAFGLATASEAYERGRPPYPLDATAFLGRELQAGPGTWLLDVAAGTGKLSRALADTGGRVAAVEPVEAMRRVFRQRRAGTWLLGGSPHALPFRDAAMDAAAIGNAFHAFADVRTLREIHRVLKPGGRLGLIWNERDASVPWVGELMSTFEQYRGDAPLYRDGAWMDAFDRFGRFRAVTRRVFPFQQTGNLDLFLDSLSSISYVASLPRPEREFLLSEATRVIRSRPAASSVGAVSMPYRCDIYIYEAG